MDKQRQKLKPEKISRLSNIFRNKGWKVISDTDVNEFDDFCTMLEYMEETQQNLILDLTEDFIQIGFSEYVKFLYQGYKNMITSEKAKFERIYIVPLLAPDDSKKIKSSATVFHLLKANEYSFQNVSDMLELKLIDNYTSLLNEKISADTLICLIDDYIGSGQTAQCAIEFLGKEGIPLANICIVSLAAQNEACNLLKQIGVPVYCSILRYKGIIQNIHQMIKRQ